MCLFPRDDLYGFIEVNPWKSGEVRRSCVFVHNNGAQNQILANDCT